MTPRGKVRMGNKEATRGPALSQVPANENLWTEHQLAEFLQVSVKSLRNQRVRGVGFPYYKLGVGKSASVRYSVSDVFEHLKSLRHDPIADTPPLPEVSRSRAELRILTSPGNRRTGKRWHKDPES